MNVVRFFLALAAVALAPLFANADMGSYFQFISPTTGTEWVNGQTNPVIWKKGLLDGVPMFDLELARLSEDGLILVALNVNANSGTLNLFLQDVPAGDDYYLLFINSTHGGMHAISPRFTILTAGSTGNGSEATGAAASATTVSISGGPDPTAVFLATFSPIAGAALPAFGFGSLKSGLGWAVAMVMGAVGAMCVLL